MSEKTSKSKSSSRSQSNGKSSGLSKGKMAAAAAGVAAAAAVGVAAFKRGRNGGTTYHLKPREEGWEIRQEGAKKAERLFDTKREALDAARELARQNEPSRLIVYRTDGSVANRHAYGEAS